MGKHVSKKIKYHYVMRYLNGESPTKLGKEVIDANLSNLNLNSTQAGAIIYSWINQYNENGLNTKSSTKGKRRPKKKKEIDLDQFTKEELKDIIRIKDKYIEIIEEDNKKKNYLCPKNNNWFIEYAKWHY